MASFDIVPKPSVEKDLRSIPKSTLLRILKQIDKLAEEPFPHQTVSWKAARSYIGFVSGIIELFMELTALPSR